jgi:hypothetical protein
MRQPKDLSKLKEWFGDSKVVDKNGDPLVVFHGTNKGSEKEIPFTSFERFSNNMIKFEDLGFWFTDSKSTAKNFSKYIDEQGDNKVGHVFSGYLKIENPWILNGEQGFDDLIRVFKHKTGTQELYESINKPENIELFIEYLKDRGRDGIIIKNVDFDKSYTGNEIVDYYVVLDSNQIKLTTGNGENYSKGGSIDYFYFNGGLSFLNW